MDAVTTTIFLQPVFCSEHTDVLRPSFEERSGAVMTVKEERPSA